MGVLAFIFQRIRVIMVLLDLLITQTAGSQMLTVAEFFKNIVAVVTVCLLTGDAAQIHTIVAGIFLFAAGSTGLILFVGMVILVSYAGTIAMDKILFQTAQTAGSTVLILIKLGICIEFMAAICLLAGNAAI